MKGLSSACVVPASTGTGHNGNGKDMTAMRVDQAMISLTIPADPVYVRLVRLVVASTAADLGFSYDRVEDVRLVASETSNLAIGLCRRGGIVRFGIDCVHGAIAVAVECPTDHIEVDFDPLARQIVAALTDVCAASIHDDKLRVAFRCPPAVA